MSDSVSPRFSSKRFIGVGAVLQMLGVTLLTISVFFNSAIIMVTLMPVGAALVCLGWLLWLVVFLRGL